MFELSLLSCSVLFDVNLRSSHNQLKFLLQRLLKQQIIDEHCFVSTNQRQVLHTCSSANNDVLESWNRGFQNLLFTTTLNLTGSGRRSYIKTIKSDEWNKDDLAITKSNSTIRDHNSVLTSNNLNYTSSETLRIYFNLPQWVLECQH